MDFKTAKEIVLALKQIAKNIQSDKSNTNTNTDNNADDNLKYVIFNDVTLGYGAFRSSMFFTLENNDPDDNTSSVYAGNEDTLGELFASDTLIKLFNKAIEHIDDMIDKGFSEGEVNMVYNINNSRGENNGYDGYNFHGNLKELLNTVVLSDLCVRFNGENYIIIFMHNDSILAHASTNTIFDQNTPIISEIA